MIPCKRCGFLVVVGLVLNLVHAQRIPYATSNLKEIPILKYSFDGPNPDGSYAFNYETGNGIAADEQGYPKTPDNHAKQGSFRYVGDDGVQYTIRYVADENGFQPEGAHIPTPPPVPEAIQRALAYNAAHPEEDGLDDAPVSRGRFG